MPSLLVDETGARRTRCITVAARSATTIVVAIVAVVRGLAIAIAIVPDSRIATAKYGLLLL